MIKFGEIKVGDYLMASYEGQQFRGEVTNLQKDAKQVCVNNGVQDFWFAPEHLHPIVLDDNAMHELNFTKEVAENGTVKYKKGAFRVLLSKEGDFSSSEIWYREDKRHNAAIEYMHQFQNMYYDMTKVHLTNEVMV